MDRRRLLIAFLPLLLLVIALLAAIAYFGTTSFDIRQRAAPATFTAPTRIPTPTPTLVKTPLPTVSLSPTPIPLPVGCYGSTCY